MSQRENCGKEVGEDRVTKGGWECRGETLGSMVEGERKDRLGKENDFMERSRQGTVRKFWGYQAKINLEVSGRSLKLGYPSCG